jgi:DNA-directed RNA polymerase subunit beta'
MMRKLRVVEEGTSEFLPGATIEKQEYDKEIERLEALEKEGEAVVYPKVAPVLLGITKASLATDSFLSAASFQETTRVLTDAASKGKKDPLLGLKENVIIGKLLPSGTGMECYSDVDIEPVLSAEAISQLTNM